MCENDGIFMPQRIMLHLFSQNAPQGKATLPHATTVYTKIYYGEISLANT